MKLPTTDTLLALVWLALNVTLPALAIGGVREQRAELQHHPTGEMLSRTPDWLVLAVPGTPTDALYHELSAAGFEVERVGDAVAPRRAHAAVIDGERAGAALV